MLFLGLLFLVWWIEFYPKRSMQKCIIIALFWKRTTFFLKCLTEEGSFMICACVSVRKLFSAALVFGNLKGELDTKMLQSNVLPLVTKFFSDGYLFMQDEAPWHSANTDKGMVSAIKFGGASVATVLSQLGPLWVFLRYHFLSRVSARTALRKQRTAHKWNFGAVGDDQAANFNFNFARSLVNCIAAVLEAWGKQNE